MRQCEEGAQRERNEAVKEMRPHDEKLTQRMTETRLGIGVGKGLRGQQGHMMESLARGCMAAEWEGGFGRRREVVGRGAGVVEERARGGASGGPTHSL